MGLGWELNKPNCCPLTCIAAAPHLHLGIIDSEHPAPGDTHICRHLHVSDVIGAGSRDVEVALSITSIKTCLGGQGQEGKETSLTHGGRWLEHEGSSLLSLSSAQTNCPLPCATSQRSALPTCGDHSRHNGAKQLPGPSPGIPNPSASSPPAAFSCPLQAGGREPSTDQLPGNSHI